MRRTTLVIAAVAALVIVSGCGRRSARVAAEPIEVLSEEEGPWRFLATGGVPLVLNGGVASAVTGEGLREVWRSDSLLTPVSIGGDVVALVDDPMRSRWPLELPVFDRASGELHVRTLALPFGPAEVADPADVVLRTVEASASFTVWHLVTPCGPTTTLADCQEGRTVAHGMFVSEPGDDQAVPVAARGIPLLVSGEGDLYLQGDGLSRLTLPDGAAQPLLTADGEKITPGFVEATATGGVAAFWDALADRLGTAAVGADTIAWRDVALGGIGVADSVRALVPERGALVIARDRGVHAIDLRDGLPTSAQVPEGEVFAGVTGDGFFTQPLGPSGEPGPPTLRGYLFGGALLGDVDVAPVAGNEPVRVLGAFGPHVYATTASGLVRFAPPTP
jgi:hypothetical protein